MPSKLPIFPHQGGRLDHEVDILFAIKVDHTTIHHPTLPYHDFGLFLNEALSYMCMAVGIIWLNDHRSPTTVGFHNTHAAPAKSLNVVREPGRVRIQKHNFQPLPRIPWLEVLVEESYDVLLSVGATWTRHHDFCELLS